MSWLDKLVETYELNAGEKGLPCLFHTLTDAHIIVRIRDGEFVDAGLITDRESRRVIIPCTEKSSAARTSQPTPHPLFDWLKYLAGDLDDHLGKSGNFTKYFAAYMEQVQKWCDSAYSDENICMVRDYLAKRRLCGDLIEKGLLPVDEQGKLFLLKPKTDKKSGHELTEYEKQASQFPVYSIAGDDLSKVTILFVIERLGSASVELWNSPETRENWQKYYFSEIGEKTGFCQVLGKEAPLAGKHPKLIGNGKLISGNDKHNFTFRGRFESAMEASAISIEASQKAHAALRWLLAKQGRHDGSQYMVAWAVASDPAVPDPAKDTADLLMEDPFAAMPEETPPPPDTAEAAAEALNKLIAGYAAKLNPKNLCFIVLDGATPGTLAIKLFRDLEGSVYLRKILHWHSACAWRQDFGKEKRFYGAPAPRDIVRAAYGEMKLDDPRLKSTVLRLLPCILDGTAIPRDIADCVVRRASHFESVDPWEFRKNLSIACSIYRYNNQKRRTYTMALDPTLSSRDYLYGRLLAVADYLEDFVLKKGSENSRPTNALRLMARFAERPYSTWRILESALVPYKARLCSNRPGLMIHLDSLLGQIHQLFARDDFVSDRPLSGEYLLGYYCQKQELFTKKDDQSELSENN